MSERPGRPGEGIAHPGSLLSLTLGPALLLLLPGRSELQICPEYRVLLHRQKLLMIKKTFIFSLEKSREVVCSY